MKKKRVEQRERESEGERVVLETTSMRTRVALRQAKAETVKTKNQMRSSSENPSSSYELLNERTLNETLGSLRNVSSGGVRFERVRQIEKQPIDIRE